jgi:hypothetical protein
MVATSSAVEFSGMTSSISYPLMAAIIARAMPVLPLVGSMIRTPGPISPRRSAPSIM